jgi:hypothetical protein
VGYKQFDLIESRKVVMRGWRGEERIEERLMKDNKVLSVFKEF